jgi:hypothetical protein
MGLLQAGRDGNMASKRQPTRHAFAPIGAEGAGFEPAVPYSGTPLFESGTINHSDTLPPHSIAYPLLGPQSRLSGSAPTPCSCTKEEEPETGGGARAWPADARWPSSSIQLHVGDVRVTARERIRVP